MLNLKYVQIFFIIAYLLTQISCLEDRVESDNALVKMKDGRYKSPNGAFLIGFKKKVIPLEQKLPIANKEINVVSYTQYEPTSARPEMVSQVTYMNLLPGSIDELDENNLLNQIKVNTLSQLGDYKIYDEHPVTTNGFPGIYVDAESNMKYGTIRIALEIFLVEDRVYNLLIYAPNQLPTKKKKDFFNSFQLISQDIN